MITTLLLALPVLPSAAPGDGVVLRHAPKEGLVVKRAISQTVDLSGGDLAVKMGGEDVPPAFLPKLTLDIAGSASLELEDRYERGGFVRGYHALAQRADVEVGLGGQGEDVSVDTSAESPLEGARVRFAPEEEGGALVAAWADADADNPSDALLEGLEADLDLVEWMPEEAVEPGARWDVDAHALLAFVTPGGQLGWEWEPEGEPAPEDELLQGTLELHLTEVVDRDGRATAIVAVAGEMTHVVRLPGSLEEVPVADGEATETRESTHVVRGELAWDVATGTLVRLELETEAAQVQSLVKDPGQPGPDYEQSTRLEGSLELLVEATLE